MNLAWLNYFVLAVVTYYVALFAMSLRRREETWNSPARPSFIIFVPCRNEELVLDETLNSLTSLQYDGDFRILVINDASIDATAAIADAWALSTANVRVVHRTAAEGGRGKSDVLNQAYRTVRSWLEDEDPWLAGHDADDIIIGIVDADGRLEKTCLQTVGPYFFEPDVGATQIGVRIFNADRSLLARMQDMEFVAFSWLVQVARDWLGSLGLGGNGQFVRLSALATLGPAPWAIHALTEDLELGLQLVEQGWRTRFCSATFVSQQGLESWRPLMRQRTRWIQGHYQCWRHIPRLAITKAIPWWTRVDLITYLLFVVLVVIVTITSILGILGTIGVITVPDSFLRGVVPNGFDFRLMSLVISTLPLTIFVGSYQRHSSSRFRWYEVPAAAACFTLYTYVWFFATLRAWTRMLLRRTTWVKTPRVARKLTTETSSAL
jgi:1,2-diacylglycerol 3-beta-glucosyltransferase